VGLSAFDRHSGEPGYRGNVADRTSLIHAMKYPTPYNDIVALMVLEHQTHMHTKQ
jgi:hypothetical protein